MRSKTYLSFFVLTGVVLLSALRPANAEAQFRGGIHIHSGYYHPFFYDPWFGFGYQYGYPPPYPYPPYGYGVAFDNSASIRVMVTPKEAEVYVDGYYAGVVNDYDGIFQRLHVPPGDHQITFYREGYHTASQKLYVAPRADTKLHYAMTPLGAGEANEPRPVAPAPEPGAGDGGHAGTYPPQYQPRRMPPPRYAPPPTDRMPPGPPPEDESANSNTGTLSIRVQPANAEILIDGERWRGPNSDEHLVVQVSEGTHRIEVRKDGFQTFSGEYDVHRGAATPVNVSLSSR